MVWERSKERDFTGSPSPRVAPVQRDRRGWQEDNRNFMARLPTNKETAGVGLRRWRPYGHQQY